MPPKYHQWTRETIDAVHAADRAYTFAWHRVMDAFDRADTLEETIAAYNAAMKPVYATWQADIAAAIAMSDDEDAF